MRAQLPSKVPSLAATTTPESQIQFVALPPALRPLVRVGVLAIAVVQLVAAQPPPVRARQRRQRRLPRGTDPSLWASDR
jgi:hypothetical protein